MKIERDDLLTEEAVRFVLKGQGSYLADGFAEECGFTNVVVRPFGKRGIDIWFYKLNDPNNCYCQHVEFGRTGGECLILEDGKG